MRVLLHSHDFLPIVGGVSRVSDTLAMTLRKKGVEVTVLTDTPPNGEVVSVPYPVFRRCTAAEKLKLVRKADLVHVNGYALRLLPYCLLQAKPLIWTHAGHHASCLNGDGNHDGLACHHSLFRCLALTSR